MIRKVILFLALSSLFIANLHAQTIKGKVIDNKSKAPIAYAMIRVEGASTGTQTNLDGEFLLKIPNNAKRVIFNSLGYRSDTIEVRRLRKNSTVRMKTLTITLKEADINDFRKPSALLKEVVRRIPENYWCDTTVGTFFFRRYSLTSDSLWLFCEAIADVMRPGYDKQYHRKLGLVSADRMKEIDSIDFAGNHKSYPLSRLLVFDTMMLRNMLGDTNYMRNPVAGKKQTRYKEKSAFFDMLQNTKGNQFLNGKRSNRLDRKAKMVTYDDDDGNSYYLITYVTDRDSTALLIDWRDKALVHYYHTLLHADSIVLPFPFNRILGGVKVPYGRVQYDYAKIDGRYTLVFSMFAKAYNIIMPKKSLINGKVNRTLREMLSDNVVEDYYVWTLVDFRKADHTFIDSTKTLPIRFSAPYNEVFGQGDPGEDFWQDYNTVPVEARIAEKLRTAKHYTPENE